MMMPRHAMNSVTANARRLLRALPRRIARGLWTMAFACFLAATMLSGPAMACATCGCDASQHGGSDGGRDVTRGLIAEEHQETRLHITEEFNDWELFLIQVLFMDMLLPALMLMTQELTAVAMHQMFILGTLFDAKQQLETQRLFDQMKAEAHKDYQPSLGMCVFGTNIRSLAAAERRAETTLFILGERSQDRQSGHVNSLGAEGPYQDKKDRLRDYVATYCNQQDYGAQLLDICDDAVPEMTNADVDFTRTVGRQMTLDIDLTDGGVSTTEMRVFRLAENLFAHNVFSRIPESYLRGNAQSNRARLLDLRSIQAKRSVAENSFNAIVAMKTMGSPDEGAALSSVDSAAYMQVIMQQLGMTNPDEITAMLGERPSYYAQMDVLTKKLYERPEFYADLYDTPANVDRKMVAMQAIDLMQSFDTLKSYLRQEMILSVLVEMELQAEHNRVAGALSDPLLEGVQQEAVGGP